MRLLLAGGPWVSARPTSSATLDPPIPVRTGSWCHKHTTPPRRLFCERKSQYLKVIYAFDDQENIQNLIDLDLSSWINPIDFLCIISHMSEVIENNGWSQTGFKFLLIDRQQYNLLLWKGKKWLLCSTHLPFTPWGPISQGKQVNLWNVTCGFLPSGACLEKGLLPSSMKKSFLADEILYDHCLTTSRCEKWLTALAALGAVHVLQAMYYNLGVPPPM